MATSACHRLRNNLFLLLLHKLFTSFFAESYLQYFNSSPAKAVFCYGDTRLCGHVCLDSSYMAYIENSSICLSEISFYHKNNLLLLYFTGHKINSSKNKPLFRGSSTLSLSSGIIAHLANLRFIRNHQTELTWARDA